jgi:nucleoside-diphosphate-sugar epimerase
MKIAIVACGWLGQPLAHFLIKDGHTIVATCRSAAKQQELQQQGITAQLFNLGDNLHSATMQEVLQADLLVLNIPPGGKHIQTEFFTHHMCALVQAAKSHGCQRLLFISTTAVYGEVQGEIVEHLLCQPATLSAKAHLTIEQSVRDIFCADASILRLAGLVGPDRHPAKYLAAKSAVSQGSQGVNLVHQVDVISAIQAIIQQKYYGSIFHLSAHEHPSRQDYYSWACTQLGLQAPEFSVEANPSQGKLINAQWTCQQLGLQLRYPSPYDMLN